MSTHYEYHADRKKDLSAVGLQDELKAENISFACQYCFGKYPLGVTMDCEFRRLLAS